jgi:hypothetical protein
MVEVVNLHKYVRLLYCTYFHNDKRGLFFLENIVEQAAMLIIYSLLIYA